MVTPEPSGQAVDYACPRCGAANGEPCHKVGRPGAPAAEPHIPRSDAARRAVKDWRRETGWEPPPIPSEVARSPQNRRVIARLLAGWADINDPADPVEEALIQAAIAIREAKGKHG